MATESHQAVRKFELQTLVSEFEQKTLRMLAEYEASASPLNRMVICTQLTARIPMLVRFQSMDITSATIDWSVIDLGALEASL